MTDMRTGSDRDAPIAAQVLGHRPQCVLFDDEEWNITCPGNQGCNALMPKQLTLARARAIVAYLERVAARDEALAAVDS